MVDGFQHQHHLGVLRMGDGYYINLLMYGEFDIRSWEITKLLIASKVRELETSGLIYPLFCCTSR